MKIDLKDSKLILALDENGRATTQEIAGRLGMSQEAVHYRMHRLEKRGIVKGYMTLLNFSLFGHTGYGIYARLYNVDPERKSQIMRSLAADTHVYWLAEFGGTYDLAIGVLAKNIVEFNSLYGELQAKYKEVLRDFVVAIRVGLAQFPRNYLLGLNKMTDHVPHFGKNFDTQLLDVLDKQLLHHLGADGRKPLLQIAKEIGKPVSTVHARFKHLRQRGIIQGFTSQTNCHALGYQSYQLFLTTKNVTEEVKNKLFMYCNLHPNIIYFIETVGVWNYEIIYEVESQQMFQDFLVKFRTEFSDILEKVETAVLFDHFVKYNQYPLDA